MSSTAKSKKGTIIALAGIAILSIIVILVGARSFPFPDGAKFYRSGIGPDNGKSQDFTITQCEDYSITAAVSITDVNGFVAVEPRSSATPKIIPGTPTPGLNIGAYEFVLEPGSTGNITMLYDFCPSEGKILDDSSPTNITLNSNELRSFFDQFNSTNKEMYMLNVSAEANTYVPPGASTGIKIYPSEISKVNEHSVEVIYAISATPAADEATFITANFYRICPGEILTIGDELNEESLEWASGPFYGCAG